MSVYLGILSFVRIHVYIVLIKAHGRIYSCKPMWLCRKQIKRWNSPRKGRVRWGWKTVGKISTIDQAEEGTSTATLFQRITVAEIETFVDRTLFFLVTNFHVLIPSGILIALVVIDPVVRCIAFDVPEGWKSWSSIPNHLSCL